MPLYFSLLHDGGTCVDHVGEAYPDDIPASIGSATANQFSSNLKIHEPWVLIMRGNSRVPMRWAHVAGERSRLGHQTDDAGYRETWVDRWCREPGSAVSFANKESDMQDPKTQKPVRQPELPNKNEPVQKQPANYRPVEGQGITKDERAQEQPANKKRAMQSSRE
jgi:hypothetical protein